MFNQIIQKLRETEMAHCVKIPLAVESGSRGWGFASPNSDYDCRFVYVQKLNAYLSVFNKSDVIEYAADKVFDINGWDLRKFIAQIVKSNATAFEWLSSNVIYICNDSVKAHLSEIAMEFFNPVAVSWHYLSIAANKFDEIAQSDSAKLKKYFYVLRPLANVQFIERHGKRPHMEYAKTLAEVEVLSSVLAEINRLFALKTEVNEDYEIPRNEVLLEYFANELARNRERLKTLVFDKKRDYELADVTFRKIIDEVWGDGFIN